MPIRNPMRYDCEKDKPEKEGDVLDLLRNVRRSINNLNYTFEDNDFRKVLKTIESGKHIIESRTEDTEIDLSNAYRFIKDYRYKSEGGCRSCTSIELFKIGPDETCSYCGLHESRSDVDEKKGHSPRTRDYFAEGCEDKDSKFRPLEEVLSDVEC